VFLQLLEKYLLQIKALNNIFSDLIAQLVQRRSEYATLALKTFVTAELQSKHPHNIKSIITVLRAMSSESTPPEQELALILQELAASDEYQGLLRDFVCRFVVS
jgi:predicted CopG family antitoxin